jgi:hypothetical protein
MTTAEQVERLRCISGGMGDLYSNDEILAVGVGYGIAGPLTAGQMAAEADEILAELLEAPVPELVDLCAYFEADSLRLAMGQARPLRRMLAQRPGRDTRP